MIPICMMLYRMRYGILEFVGERVFIKFMLFYVP